MIRNTLTKHMFLLLASAVVIMSFAVLGYVLSLSVTTDKILEIVPDKNNYVLLGWRLTLYLSMFICWRPLLRYYARQAATLRIKKKMMSLMAYRVPILYLTIFYEVIFVQNIVAFFIGLWE